ncbi:MAG TPA: ECF-type sigma factor [Candidatus Eisenbacteria bacterium]|nr:ECF-type sigma factor [Candidatus Eisenbacteria bacterium]
MSRDRVYATAAARLPPRWLGSRPPDSGTLHAWPAASREDPPLNKPSDKQRRTESTRILLGARSKSRAEREESQEQLHTLIDGELHGVAERAARSERPDYTVAPAALLQEIYLRLIDRSRVDWSDRARFLRIAARAMRQLLVDQARTHRASKRGSAWRRVVIDQEVIVPGTTTFDLVVLGDAFERLAKRDARAAGVTEMRLFAGLTPTEIAYLLGVSEQTAEADWSFARRWLKREIGEA